MNHAILFVRDRRVLAKTFDDLGFLIEVVSKPPLGLNPPKADKSLCWTETANPRNIQCMDACPDF
jgi:hypothetical protein